MIADTWYKATSNWSELCIAMGCERIQECGALAHIYPISRTGVFYNVVHVQDANLFSVESIEQTFAKSRLPFTITIPRVDSYAALEQSLRAHGYSLVRVWDLMVHEEDAGERNSEVEVVKVDASRLRDWFAASNLSDLPSSIRYARYDMISNALLKGSTLLLLAYLNSKPVGTGLLFSKGGVASIHMMTTVQEFRRRHVATTILLDTLDRLKDEEIDLVWLRTRKGGMGEKVYAKTGFESLLDILTYTKTPNLEDILIDGMWSPQ
jgi:hypothetical protein